MTQTWLAKDRYNHAIQCVAPGASHDITVTSGASTVGSVIPRTSSVVRVVATVDVRIAIGPAATVAAGAADLLLPAGAVEYFRVPHELDAGAGVALAARGESAGGKCNVTVGL